MRQTLQASLGLTMAVFCSAAAAAESPEDVGASWSSALELGVGYETYRNPSALIDDVNVVQPGTGRVERGSQYLDAILYLDLTLPLSGSREWIGNLELEARRTPALPELDKQRLRLYTGPSLALEDAELELLLAMDELDLGGGDFKRHGLGLRSNIVWNEEARRHVVTLDWLRYRHDGIEDLYDGDRVNLRYARRQTLEGEMRPTITLRTGVAADRNRWGFDDLSGREWLFDIEASAEPSAGWRWSASLGMRLAGFQAPAPGLTYKRRDRRVSLLLEAERQLGKDASLSCAVETIHRESSDPLAETDMRRIGCALKWAF